jgi:hypothetical protein
MGKRFRRRAGDIVALPLPSGGYAYSRILSNRVLMAFYNLRTDNLTDPNEVVTSGTLFVTAVHMTAISNERWVTMGNRPLEQELIQDTKFFRKNPTGDGFLIYISKAEPSGSDHEYEASADECRGLEPLLVWEPDQIEQRIDDHFQKRDNLHLSHYMQQIEKQDLKRLH